MKAKDSHWRFQSALHSASLHWKTCQKLFFTTHQIGNWVCVDKQRKYRSDLSPECETSFCDRSNTLFSSPPPLIYCCRQIGLTGRKGRRKRLLRRKSVPASWGISVIGIVLLQMNKITAQLLRWILFYFRENNFPTNFWGRLTSVHFSSSTAAGNVHTKRHKRRSSPLNIVEQPC